MIAGMLLLIGRSVGLWLESLWIGAVYHSPWPITLWREALPTAVPVAILVGVCAAMLGMVLTSQRLPGREAERLRVPAGRPEGDHAVRVSVRTGVLID